MKISKSKKILILLLAFVLLLPAVRVNATMGNVFVFLHSEDFFAGNNKTVGLYYRDFVNKGHGAMLAARPTAVYGMQEYLKNAEALFVCCHGKNEGSILLVDIVGTKEILFRTSDVPKSMDCKLAYIGACRSAQNNTETGKNLCGTLVSNGYKAVIGYNTDVVHVFAIQYEESFFDYLAQGKSVYASTRETELYLIKKGEREDPEEYERIINSVSKFGNLGLTIE